MDGVNDEQAEFWSTAPGAAWITHQETFDTLLAGGLEAVLDHAAPKPGETVIDIGCGTGASLLRLSDLVGPSGHVTGLDISAPFLDVAAARTAGRGNLRLVHADAQVHAFTAGAADLIVSRFGVMFFADPVAAFANLRRALRPGGRLAMLCWQGASENPWFSAPMQAASDRLGRPAPTDPHAPGPMAFSGIDRVTGILRDAGWAGAQGRPLEVDLIPPQTPAEAAVFATTAGPAARLLREKEGTEADRAAIEEDCAARFARFETARGLRIPARLIVYTARRAGG